MQLVERYEVRLVFLSFPRKVAGSRPILLPLLGIVGL